MPVDGLRGSGEIGKLKKSGADASALMREGEEVSEAIRSGEGLFRTATTRGRIYRYGNT